MTSPAQLKYLDAMGIPVWVSRDLIIEDYNEIELIPSPLNPQLATQQQTVVQPVNKSNSSAQSILDSLEGNSTKTTARTQNIDTITILNDSVAKSVNSAKHTDKPSSVSPATPALANENLLFKSSHHHVYASGSETADWMVVGHSPEPFNGIGQEPFAGEAGDLLNNMLRAVGIEQPRIQAYLLNVVDINQSAVKDLETQQKLKQDLLAVIDKVKPKILLFVGQVAPQNLLNCSDPLIIMRSKVHNISDSNIPCVVTYYPSYLLQKPTDKRKAWDDLKLALSLLSDDN